MPTEKTETPPPWATEILQRIAFLEKVTNLTDTLRSQQETERIWHETKALKDLPDPRERVSALVKMQPAAQLRFWQHHQTSVDSDLDSAIATLRAASTAQRNSLLQSVPSGMQLALAIHQLPPPRRVKLSLKTGLTRVECPPVRDPTEATSYRGLKFSRDGGDGQEHFVMLRSMLDRTLEIDSALGEHIKSGAIVVETLSDLESMRLLRMEIQALNSDERPTLVLV